MKFYKTILVRLKHIFYGKYAYILMPWGAMGWLVGPVYQEYNLVLLEKLVW